MKKLILFLTTITLLNVSSAQTNNVLPTGVQVTPEGIETPVIVLNKFNIDYPNTNAIWKMDGDNYVAQFTDQTTNINNLIIYDEGGNLIRKDKEIDNASYPKIIGDYFTKNYPNENYVVWLSESSNGDKSYYTIRKSTTIWFDKTGRYLSIKNREITKK